MSNNTSSKRSREPTFRGRPVPDDQRDHALGFHWGTDLAAFASLGLPAPASRHEEKTRAAILTEAALVGRADPEMMISYSRTKAFYGPTRYRLTSYGYRTVVGSVDLSDRYNVMEHDRAWPGRFGWQSRIRATAEVIACLDAAAAPAIVYERAEPIILRDRAKNRLDYRDNDQTRAMRRYLKTINEGLLSITVSHPDVGIVRPGDPIRFGDANSGPARPTLHRIFTNDWKHHGRFYGGWWQNIPKEERARLLINGEDTAEHDYPSFHISLAYAVAGVPIPSGDLYGLQTDRWPRNLVKLAANTMLNARDRRAALGAVVQEAVEGGILVRRRGIFANVSELLDAVEHRHSAIQRAFFSDAGLTLMNVDSGMAERIMLTLLRRGIVVLPVHDSFLIWARKMGLLQEVMEGEFQRVLAQWNRRVLTPCQYSEIGPSDRHNGGRALGMEVGKGPDGGVEVGLADGVMAGARSILAVGMGDGRRLVVVRDDTGLRVGALAGDADLGQVGWAGGWLAFERAEVCMSIHPGADRVSIGFSRGSASDLTAVEKAQVRGARAKLRSLSGDGERRAMLVGAWP